ncbi:MAG: pirin family protein [Gammaproteobacteria bacterium]|nr:pirin family protein [Gammaproteobacteria bacterium]MDE2346376.1 pirin family protein [Gammaproteobacteria bacterium]
MTAQVRSVARVIEPQRVSDGAGVKLKRSIATASLDYLDPFLLFDHFGSDNPDDYIAGFPMHPHRGIETVTYMHSGVVEHKDSLGHAGSIAAGDVQWMTAGHGILHEEMPQLRGGHLSGFQLWVNLPARLKLTKPVYQEVSAKSIPEIVRDGGVRIRVIAGKVDGVQGAVREIAADPAYLDVMLPANASFRHAIARGHTAFAYIYEGDGQFGIGPAAAAAGVSAPKLVVFSDGDSVEIQAGKAGVRFLLISGKPLHEPVARYGPFVMNTPEEIQQALMDLRNGTFV